MTSCDKIKDATTVEKTFTMTIPPTDFTYTDTTTVKSSGMILIYSRMMFFNIADSLAKYNLTGSMAITNVEPTTLIVESNDNTPLTWAQLLMAKASSSSAEGKLFGFGIPTGYDLELRFIFLTEGVGEPIKTQMINEQPVAFETMKAFPYYLQVYAKTSGTVTMPKTVNLKISGKFTIKSNITI
jgi:hypothetical protein